MRVIAALLFLTGCASAAKHAPPAVIPAKPPQPTGFCDIAKPIRFSKNDKLTPETASQILAHNDSGKKLCGWKP